MGLPVSVLEPHLAGRPVRKSNPPARNKATVRLTARSTRPIRRSGDSSGPASMSSVEAPGLPFRAFDKFSTFSQKANQNLPSAALAIMPELCFTTETISGIDDGDKSLLPYNPQQYLAASKPTATILHYDYDGAHCITDGHERGRSLPTYRFLRPDRADFRTTRLIAFRTRETPLR
jgi:hypothetical protein